MNDAARVTHGYLEFRGGRGALEGLKVVERIGRIEVHAEGGVTEGTYRTCIAYPHSGAIQVEAGELRVAELLCEGRAFICGPGFADPRPATEEQTASLQRTAREANREVLFEFEALCSGRCCVDSGVISVETLVDSTTTRYDFRGLDGALLRKHRGSHTRAYADWRMVGGVRFPHHVRDYDGGVLRFEAKLQAIQVRPCLQGTWCEHLLRPGP